jgi:hypothetical protein
MPEMTEIEIQRGTPEPGAEPTQGRLAELYERHAGSGMRLAFLLTGNRTQAEDLLQEAFVRCVGRFRYLRVPDAFDAYLRRAIVNLHTSGLRRKRLERAWAARERGAGLRVASMPDVALREDLWRRLAALPAPPACGARAPLLRGPVRTRDRGGAGLLARGREIADRSRDASPARRDPR